MGFNPNPIDGPPTVELHLTSSTATSVTVNYPVNSPTFTTTVPVTPGSITVVDLPSDASTAWIDGAPDNNAVRAFAPDEFVVYMINRETFTSDAALALPVDALNNEYIVQSYTASFRGQFVVVAAFDNTEVTITPSRNLQSGQAAGTPFTITLNRGEGFLGQAASRGVAGDLTGTTISSSRPVTMTNGNYCTNVPPTAAACDHIFEVAQPLASWGQDALVAPLPNRPGGSIYRVLAAEDDTEVTLDGAVVATLNRGEFYDSGEIPGAHIFASDSEDKPIFVTQFMTGVTSQGATLGDPAQGNMIPSEQYLFDYTFATVEGAFSQHFLSVIASNDDVANGTILLDGTTIPAGSFAPIGSSGYSYVVLPLDEGTHTTSSVSAGHGITVQGYNQANSYIYPGGARFQFIFQGEDDTPPVCEGSVDIDTFFGTATDLLADDPDNTGIFFVALGEGSENLALSVDPFTPGDETVSYQVTRTDPTMSGEGAVVVTDGAGNTCTADVTIPADGTSDTEAPVCGEITIQPVDGTYDIVSSATDNVGIASVTFTTLTPNLDGYVDDGGAQGPFMQGDVYTTGDPDPTSVGLRARFNTLSAASFFVTVADAAGNEALCDPVLTDLAGALPEMTALLPSYPNPARVGSGAAVSVPFRLAEASKVRVVVYDVLGREVAVLADGVMEPGSYEVSWPEASSLPSGSYVVRMTAGAHVQTQRLTLVR
jgi:hypothetical protein